MTAKRTLALTVALALILSVGIQVAATQSEETVAFNVETQKYHCVTCTWAIRCTKNCIKIPLSEAKRRGGIPCKVCGGTCK